MVLNHTCSEDSAKNREPQWQLFLAVSQSNARWAVEPSAASTGASRLKKHFSQSYITKRNVASKLQKWQKNLAEITGQLHKNCVQLAEKSHGFVGKIVAEFSTAYIHIVESH